MRSAFVMATAIVLAAAPAFSQPSGTTSRQGLGFVSGLGGFTRSGGDTTGNMLVEGGGRVAPHVMVFGDFGRFANLQTALQPTLSAATAALAASDGIGVTGGGTLPAWYGVGGLRAEIPTRTRVSPYVLGGLGFAHLNPQPTFAFQSGVLPDGTTPATGTDVTSAVTGAGLFTAPPTETDLMVTLGGGVQLSVAPRWVVDAGYRYARVGVSTTLSATPLNANGMTFGLGYRF
jgi:opacity protein-like surface antigen